MLKMKIRVDKKETHLLANEYKVLEVNENRINLNCRLFPSANMTSLDIGDTDNQDIYVIMDMNPNLGVSILDFFGRSKALRTTVVNKEEFENQMELYAEMDHIKNFFEYGFDLMSYYFAGLFLLRYSVVCGTKFNPWMILLLSGSLCLLLSVYARKKMVDSSSVFLKRNAIGSLIISVVLFGYHPLESTIPLIATGCFALMLRYYPNGKYII